MITNIVLFLLLSIFYSNINNAYGQLNTLPGAEMMKLSYNLLTGEDVQSIIDLTYNDGRSICHKGMCYGLPDQFSFYELNSCDTRGQTELIRTKDEWKKSYSSKTTIETDSSLFGDISGSHSKEYKTFKSNTNEFQSATAIVFIGCDEFEILLRPNTFKFSENVYADLQQLPVDFNEGSRGAYFAFFNKYGTVFTHRAIFGGRMFGDSFTKYSYTKKVDETTMTEQTQASFFFQITHESQYSSKLTKEYNESTHHYEISTYGGDYFDPKETDFTKWIVTIPNAPVVTFKEFYMISDLFNIYWITDSNVNKYYNSMRLALDAFYNVPGCTDSDADNYDPSAIVDDGSCVYLLRYTDEYTIIRATPNPGSVGLKMIHQDEGFCYICYTEYCETQCRVEVGADGYWYVKSRVDLCTANPDYYCGARCTYIHPLIQQITSNTYNFNNSNDITQNALSSYGIYFSYNPIPFRLMCNLKRIDRIMYKDDGFCYVAQDDYHGTQCQTRIDADGYWYALTLQHASGHNCDQPLCIVYCASIEFNKIQEVKSIGN